MPPGSSPRDCAPPVVVALTTLGVPLDLRLSAPTPDGAAELEAAVRRAWDWAVDARMVPHPKPLSIVQPGSPLKDQVGPAAAGLARPADPGSLAAVVMLERDGTPTVDLEPVRTAAAIALLAEQTSYLGRLPRPLSFVAEILERTRGVFVAHYREAADLEPALDVLVTR